MGSLEAHSKDPWFHSWNSPKAKIINNKKTIEAMLILLPENKLTKNGNKITNSTSKTKKIRAIRKNRKVKGKRALNLGVTPHSKGLIFSRSRGNFFLNLIPAIITNSTSNIINKIKTIKVKILKTYKPH